MATTKSRAGDMTGRVREQQAAKYKAELDARAEEIGLASSAREAEILNEVTDFTKPVPVVIPDNSPIDYTEDEYEGDVLDATPQELQAELTLDRADVEELEVVEQAAPTQVIYMLEELENTTIGVGNTRDYHVGQKYLVTAEQAAHLIGKGYAR